jgi:hypothetical protein
MTSGEEISFLLSSPPLCINETANNTNSSNPLFVTPQAVLIAFHIGQVVSIFCIVFGILGNSALIFSIYRSSYCRFPYGLLLVFISTFDIIRLISTAFYYLIQAYIIPLNLATVTIYITSYRYPKNVTNWLKVFLAVERLFAVKSWIVNRYNVNSTNTTKVQRSKQRRILYFIFLLLTCSLISQHPNFIPIRYISPRIDPARLLILVTPNPNFYYGNQVFNGILFTIISYIILDDLLPIIILLFFNTILLYKLQHLPLITSKKIAESIWILFFLTIFSIFVVPHSFIVFFNLYADQQHVNDTSISVAFHTFEGNIHDELYDYLMFVIIRFGDD